MENTVAMKHAMRRPPMEISVQAQLCSNGSRFRNVGDLITYHSAVWLIKGLYFSAARSDEPELYYILSETSPAFEELKR